MQQVIVVKVGDAPGGGVRALHAYSVVRGAAANPVQTVDFSLPAATDGAAGPDSLALQLHVPLACLYYQAAGGPPPGIADPLDVDLLFVQQAALLRAKKLSHLHVPTPQATHDWAFGWSLLDRKRSRPRGVAE